MEAYLQQFGLGGIISYILNREIFLYLAKKREKEKTSESISFQRDIDSIKKKLDDLKALEVIQCKVEDLYSWHNHFDQSGRFVWYKDFEFEKTVDRLGTAVAVLTELIRKISNDINEVKITIQNKDMQQK